MSGNISQAYRLAEKIISARYDTAFGRLSVYSRFLNARMLYYRNLPDEAITQYLELLKLKNSPLALTRDIYTSLATIYMNNQDFAKAIYYFKIQDRNNASYHDPYFLMEIYSSFAICFLKTKHWRQAEYEFKKSIHFCKQLNDTPRLTELYLKIAGEYQSAGMDNNATAYLKKALHLSTTSKDFEEQLTIHLQMMIIEEKNRKYKTALQYSKISIALTENIRGTKLLMATGNREKKNRKYGNWITAPHLLIK